MKEHETWLIETLNTTPHMASFHYRSRDWHIYPSISILISSCSLSWRPGVRPSHERGCTLNRSAVHRRVTETNIHTGFPRTIKNHESNKHDYGLQKAARAKLGIKNTNTKPEKALKCLLLDQIRSHPVHTIELLQLRSIKVGRNYDVFKCYHVLIYQIT